jgi:hypothetical protein
MCVWLIAALIAVATLAISLERRQQAKEIAAENGTSMPNWRTHVFQATSFADLSGADREIAAILVLIPVAAFIICIFRNVIGLTTYGSFSPALIGLAFRNWDNGPGLAVFLAILFAAWLIRRRIESLHLLQIPRSALMLTIICALLLGFLALARFRHGAASPVINLFPLVILVGVVERFWMTEEESGAWTSFRMLSQTLLAAMCVAVVCGREFLTRHLLSHPESLGYVAAALLLLGRFTGYRITEMFRFREAESNPTATPTPVTVEVGRTSASWRRF